MTISKLKTACLRRRQSRVHRHLLFVVAALLVPLVVAANNSDIHTVAIPDAVVSEASDGLRPFVLRNAGAPELPFHDVAILLPPGRELDDVSVVPADVPIFRSGDVLPNARPLVSSEGETVRMREVPADADLYPRVWGEALGTTVWHGFRTAHVRLYPQRAHRDGVDGLWTTVEEVRRFDIAVTTRPAAAAAVNPSRRREGEHQRHRDLVAGRVVNPEAVSLYPDPSRVVATADKGFAPSASPSMIGSAVDFLIITSPEMEPVFEQLATWRTQLGVPSAVRTMDWIEQVTLPAEDRPATLRKFLTDAYERWGVRWVLLGGDVEIIPARMIYSTYYPSGSGTDIPVDLYYGGLDGNWNIDGDEKLGEPYMNGIVTGDDADLVAELFVGRAPVTDAATAQVFVDKVLAYEYEQVGSHNGRLLMMSEVLNPSEYSSGDLIYDDGAVYSEDIVDQILADKSVTVERLYETWDIWPGSQPETRSSSFDAMDGGQYGIVNHVGHGFFYTMSVGTGSLGVSDATNLRNGPNFFLLNNLNCASAAFDYNSIMERFMTNPDGGAVAALGSSRAAFASSAGAYQFSFFDALYNLASPTLGEAFADSRAPFDGMTYDDSLQRWTHLTLSLLGDPAMRIWATEPDETTVTLPASVGLGPQTLEVLVERDGAPLDGATVCLYRDGEDYVVATTGVDGRVVADFTSKSEGELSVGVTYDGCRPFLGSVPVEAAGPAYLRLAGAVVVDDGTLGSVGNGDGLPDAGETIALMTDWTNTGPSDSGGSSNVYVVLDDPNATKITHVFEVPQTNSGATSAATGPILIAFDVDTPDRTEVLIGVVAVVDGAACPDETTIEVYAPEMEAVILGLNDFPLGDGDGVPESGEQIRLWLSLLNTGWGRAEGLTGWIETETQHVTVVDGDASWPDADRFAEVEQLDEMIVSMYAVNEVVEAVLHITDSVGHEWIHTMSLTVPAKTAISSASSPTGGEALLTWTPNTEADVYGYHVWRASDLSGPFIRQTIQPLVGATFFRETDLDPLSTFYYKVATVDEARILSRFSSILPVSTPPGEITGFPVAMTSESSSHVAVGDVNGDGVLDMVSAADAVYAWSADGNELYDGDDDPLTLGQFTAVGDVWTPAGVALGNITNHPGMEIVASCRSDQSIYVFQGDGSVASGWPKAMNSWNWSTPSVGDLDADGDLEIVVTNALGRTYVWHHDGTEFLDGDANPATDGVFHVRDGEWYSFSSPALVDFDGDDTLEIVLATKIVNGSSNYVHVLRNDGSEQPGWPLALSAAAKVQSSPAVADLDADGVLEIVFISEDDKLHVVDQFGLYKAPFPIPFTANNTEAGGVCPSPALGDIDQDGRLDIVVVSVSDAHTSSVHVLDVDGNALTGWPRSTSGASESSPLIADVDGDGRLDVIFGIGGASDTDPNNLYAFNHVGAALPGFPLPLAGPIRATPTLCDVDSDGDIDLVYAGWDLAMHVWDFPAPWVPELAPWPTYQGNPLRTGLQTQEWITSVDEPVPVLPSSLQLSQNSPNPFNPVTVISFALPEGAEGRTTLEVHDLRGRLVATLVDAELAAGRYDVTWDGRDDRQRAQASGVYLYKLSSGEESRNGRMVLVR